MSKAGSNKGAAAADGAQTSSCTPSSQSRRIPLCRMEPSAPVDAEEPLAAALLKDRPPNAGAEAAPKAGAPPRLNAGVEAAPNMPPKAGAAAGAAAAGLATGAAGAGAASGLAAPARLKGGSSGTGAGAVAAGLAGGEGAAAAAGRARALAAVTRMPPPSPWQRCSSCCCRCCQRPAVLLPAGEAPPAGDTCARGERRGWLTGVWLLLLPRRWEAGDSATSCQGDLRPGRIGVGKVVGGTATA